MIVVGIDPSLTSTGIAEGGDAYTLGGESPAGDGMQLDRVVKTATIIASYALAWMNGKVALFVVEAPSLYSKSSGHERTVGLHYLLRYLLTREQWPVAITHDVLDVAPSTLKVFATGNGRADKFDVILAARERLGYEGKSDDEADALWLEQIGHHLLGDGHAVKLPKTHTRALAKIAWKVPT